MDAEPFRCRRTDGKKWRCRLPVLPDHKYCERHVHRGRICSRKSVEEVVDKTFLNSKIKSPSTTPISSLKTAHNLQSYAKTNDTKVSIENQSLKTEKHSNDLGCGASSNDHNIGQSERCRRTDGKRWRCKKDVLPNQKYCERHVHRGRICSRKPVEVVDKTFLESKSTAMTSISFPKTTPNLQSHAKTNETKVSIKNQSLKIKKHSMETACNGNDLGCGASSNDHKIGQSERCRRTDGKKWRCKKDVLPGLQYCVRHLHRGVMKVENGQSSNPSLSFPVGARYQQMGGNGNQSNDSRSSSEATTISM
ncbi:putative transcription factor interactor and regulator C3H-WRC/GRF family [Helianthus annuus]|uniref:Growth-regulating factor n=1 Tax=Helianthus annuus TaxID=4232 RepID=A0A251VD01_HELAN|nr:growth-regulating factor 9 isoform X1 [Helianthus annuus]XP_022030176.1 growth-regulating factor 9 isoform X1 [Helianthus annuus]KAF5816783.1 putative transcription factor interactor and regulator C3H-WRC/GRF family [Helianthus annuus]KAJ0610047.1 putative transcription factor interactor and regulator C3H-WRC/GRF family [Helianthus annuus]KAJ0775828.1 putative transcription factor interactor and regulator C3H-WRC/GRF family [Helianthus annuus]KAJ0938129.1 putative transcription factor inter